MSLNEGTCYAPCRLLHPEAWATVLVIFVHTSSATLRLASTSPQMWRQRRKADSSAAALGLPPVVVARCLSALYVVESSMKRHSFEIGTSSLCLAFSPVEHHFTDTSHSSSAVPERLCIISPWVCKASSSSSPRLPHSVNPFIDWGRQCWVSWINLDRRIFPITKRERVSGGMDRQGTCLCDWSSPASVCRFPVTYRWLIFLRRKEELEEIEVMDWDGRMGQHSLTMWISFKSQIHMMYICQYTHECIWLRLAVLHLDCSHLSYL